MLRRRVLARVAILLMGASLVFTLDVSAQNRRAEGAIDKVWIEYGVKAKGEFGLRIHTKFSVTKAANIGCVILAIIVRADGRPLHDGGSAYSTSDGRVAVHKAFTPPYDPANYPDTKFFIPYWALSLKEDNPNNMKVTVTLLNQGREFARATLDFRVALGKVR